MKPLRFFIMALLCAVANLAWGDDMTGTITFGSASGSTNINKTEVAGNDNLNNKWTITTVFSGTTTSFTPQPGYAQVGSSNTPATSITFTTTLPESQTITAFEAKFGGFSNTAGDIELKVNNTVVGSGSLNGSRDVTVISTTQEASGTVLTVTVTNIDKGVKCYYIKYSYTTSTSTVKSPTFSPAGNTYTEAQNVAISSATEGATIYYTTDSSNPKTSETRSIYSEPVFVSKSGTQIQAYAEYGTMEPSPVVSANYIIKPETPTLSAEGNTVTITTDQENLTYYYNTGTSYNDTDNPDENSTEYNRPIEMSKSAYFKAIAYDQYGNPSGIKSFDFHYYSPPEKHQQQLLCEDN